MIRQRLCLLLVLSGLLGACSSGGDEQYARPAEDPFPSTYEALPSRLTAIVNATLLTGDGQRIDRGSVLMRDGRIAAVGDDIAIPEDAQVIEAQGRWVTPGIIDTHSHLGLYPSPGVAAHDDGNEMTDPVTAQFWAEHSIWPQDPGFITALQGGVTAMQILPGSANLIGGRSVTIKNVPSRTVQGLKFPGAPHGLKMACGENPKRIYGAARKVAPMTRMGNVAGYRQAWIDAQRYRDAWKAYEAGKTSVPPERDLSLETLVGVLEGEILVHNHCYRADEMAIMLDIAREFGYKVSSFHHAVEAYKIADLLAEHDTCASMWADWWGFKIEAFDMVRENIALVDKAGACAIVHSDSDIGMQFLNQEAAKVVAAANRAGIDVDEARAWRWLSLNPARALGIDEQTGSLAEGKMADLVIWDGNPFSVYTRTEQVYIDGALIYDRHDPAYQPRTDFSFAIDEAAGVSR